MSAPRFENVYELSPMQQGILFHTLLDPAIDLYFEQSVVTLRGAVDAGRFAAAWDRVVKRHSILRTSFHWEGLEKPVQVVHPEVALPFESFDWTDCAADEQASRLESFLECDRRKSFDLTSPPLVRIALFRMREDAYECVLTFQHVLLDRWSRFLVLKDVFEEYAEVGRDEARAHPPPYSDYIAWLQRQDRGRAEEFWRRSLAGFTTPAPLGSALGSAGSGGAGENANLHLSPQATERVQAFARRHRLTVNTVVQGAWAILLSRYGAGGDVLFGATVSGRPPALPNVDSMVGLFINSLPVRVRVEPEESVVPWLHGLQTRLLELRDYEYSSLIDIQGWSEIPRGVPLFESLVVFENVGTDPDFLTDRRSPEVAGVRSVGGATNYPLTLLASPGRELSLRLQADGSLFRTGSFQRGAATRMLDHYRTLLERLVSDPDQAVGSLTLLTEDERRRLLVEWNRTERPYDAENVIELFERQVRSTPLETAVSFEGERLTYTDLNERANRLASALTKRGVGPGALVGLCLQRSLDLAVGVLGILKAGGAYVPLDPDLPRARLSFMIENSGPRAIVTREALEELLPAHAASRLRLDADAGEIAQESGDEPSLRASGDDLAYVIYTSGSTGKPKGVEMPHRALANLVQWQMEDATEPRARTLQFASLNFDVSFQEMFSTWCAGGELVMVSEEIRRDPAALWGVLAARSVERLFLPFVALQHLAEAAEHEAVDAPALREVITAGEQLQITPQIARLFASDTPPRVLKNQYGPSETHVATSSTLEPPASAWPNLPPIGRPIANTRVYILDPAGRPLPIGVPGEIFIGGTAVGSGYRGRPDLTRERFVSDLFAPAQGARLYRTGDLARYRTDGQIEFLGRLDHQVKIRGYRVELGEIEALLREVPGVRDAVVVARERAGGKRLAAYVVPENASSMLSSSDTRALSSSLRTKLKESLPDYMVPSAILLLDALPMTHSGKVDRAALPEPEMRPDLDDAFAPPRTPVEEVLAGIWAQVLSIDRVGTLDDFFALGGHSLLATQLVSRVRATFGIDLPLRAIFEAPTLEALARRVSAARAGQAGGAGLAIGPAPRDRDLELSFGQQRLWFLDQLEPGKAFYSISRAVRLTGDLDVRALESALTSLVARHETLRTRFLSRDGRPVQVIEPENDFRLSVTNLTSLPKEQRQPEALRLGAAKAARPFDLTAAPLLRAALFLLSEQEHVLVLAMHHIVSDGWSMGILVRELAAFYEEARGGRRADLKHLPVQFVDFAAWQREWLRGEELERQSSYWKAQLADLPLIEIPTDRAHPTVRAYRGARQSITFSPQIVAKLREITRSEGATLYMTMLAAFQTFLLRYTGQEDVVVGSPIAGRNREDTEGLIGFFVNNLVMRTDLSGNPTFREAVGRVKDVALAAYAHQDLPFEKLVEEMQPQRDLGQNPLFQVLFALQNVPSSVFELGGLTVAPLSMEGKSIRFDLEVYVQEISDSLSCIIIGATDLFEPATLVRMGGHFRELVESIAANPDRRLGELDLLPAAERRQLLEAWNKTDAEYPWRSTVHGLFEEQAARAPEAVAVAFGSETLTYGALNERSNRLARYLSARGVGPEVLVGVCVERSLEMVVGLLGILKAGGAFVPLDPGYPAERLEFMLKDAGARVVLTQQRLMHTLPEGSFELVRLDADWGQIEQESGENCESTAMEETLAYVIYTSGSTGTPKGVEAVHRAIVNRLAWMWQAYPFARGEVCCQKTTLSFVDSIWEVFGPLLAGVPSVILSQEDVRDPRVLVSRLSAAGVSRIVLVPSLLSALLDSGIEAKSLPKLKWWMTSGERLSMELYRRFREAMPDAVLINLYGSSEVSADVTCWDSRGREPLHSV